MDIVLYKHASIHCVRIKYVCIVYIVHSHSILYKEYPIRLQCQHINCTYQEFMSLVKQSPV